MKKGAAMLSRSYASHLLRPFLAALTLSLIVLGLVFFMAPASHADSAAANFPSFTIQRPFGDQSSVTKSVAVGDINADRFKDIVAGADGGQNKVYLGGSTGVFTETTW